MKAFLALEDGQVFEGKGFGVQGEVLGEIVFNTALTGYQEIITDPSYKGQIVVMTYPHIGNYGINSHDCESARPWVEGFVVRELSPAVSNFRAEMSLEDYFKEHGKIGIQGIDTRKLVRHLRDHGAKKAVLSTLDDDPKSLIRKAAQSPGIVGIDLVKEVTCPGTMKFRESLQAGYEWGDPGGGTQYRVVVIDCGVKWNILRKLCQHGFDVTVVPASATFEEIRALHPDGVFLSNGPGDPAAVPYLIDTVRSLLLGSYPIFGICLGHQILGQALGGTTSKLKFGHHGGNHPVMDLATRKIEITSQNHGFIVDIESLPGGEVDLTHINLNDQTLEGLRHTRYPAFSVQYHPENSPGPHDSDYLFRRFVTLIEKGA